MKKVIPGLISLIFAAFCLAGYLPAQQTEEFAKTLPLSAGGSFKLSNVNGQVTISTWKEAKVEIRAVKKTRKSADNLEKVKIEVTESVDAVSVKTVYPKHENTGVTVDYTIQVPEGVRLENVETVNGNVNVTGPFSAASAGTTNGNVRVENASGDLKFETTNGDIEAVNLAGPVEVETTNGGITLDLNALKGDIRAETTNGGITVKMGGAGQRRARGGNDEREHLRRFPGDRPGAHQVEAPPPGPDRHRRPAPVAGNRKRLDPPDQIVIN